MPNHVFTIYVPFMPFCRSIFLSGINCLQLRGLPLTFLVSDGD